MALAGSLKLSLTISTSPDVASIAMPSMSPPRAGCPSSSRRTMRSVRGHRANRAVAEIDVDRQWVKARLTVRHGIELSAPDMHEAAQLTWRRCRHRDERRSSVDERESVALTTRLIACSRTAPATRRSTEEIRDMRCTERCRAGSDGSPRARSRRREATGRRRLLRTPR